jgi:hypothetical protein
LNCLVDGAKLTRSCDSLLSFYFFFFTTTDNEDHTFCGIMFPLRVKNNLPVEHILLHSISVRGRLGDLTVHVSNEVTNTTTTTPGTLTTTPTTEIPLHASHWTQIYQGRHKMTALGRNRRRGGGGETTYAKLEFSKPLLLKPGQVRLLYVHSTHDGDESIVYDNSSGANFNIPRYQDDFIAIHTGKAHLSPEPFGQSPVRVYPIITRTFCCCECDHTKN